MILSSKHNEKFLPYLSERAISKLDKEETIILLPIASIEQHGPHLPVYTDSLIALEMLSRILDKLDPDVSLFYLPLLSFGRSVEHLGIPGTISLSSTTLLKVLEEIAASVAEMGFKRFVLLNTHGGNSELIDVAMRDIRVKHNLYMFGLHVFLRIASPSYGLSEEEITYGIHAGDIETSILLHCCPELVDMTHAPDSLPSQLIDGQTPPFADALNFAWLTRDLTASGVLGNAQTADPDRGAKYLEDAALECVELIRKAAVFKFPN